jgi:hypothetical protein
MFNLSGDTNTDSLETTEDTETTDWAEYYFHMSQEEFEEALQHPCY